MESARKGRKKHKCANDIPLIFPKLSVVTNSCIFPVNKKREVVKIVFSVHTALVLFVDGAVASQT